MVVRMTTKIRKQQGNDDEAFFISAQSTRYVYLKIGEQDEEMEDVLDEETEEGLDEETKVELVRDVD